MATLENIVAQQEIQTKASNVEHTHKAVLKAQAHQAMEVIHKVIDQCQPTL